MKRDLWKELVQRAREESPGLATAPFGFEREVLRRASQEETRFLPGGWMPVLKPALVLAMGIMAICLAVQFSIESSPGTGDLLSETDALLTTALFVE